MGAQQEYDGEDSNEVDLQRFMENAKAMARLNGACVFEFFTCPNPECGFQQAATHPFREVVCCAKCGQRMASRVPRIELPGEVTRDHLTEAIRVVRMCNPEPPGRVQEYLDAQEPQIKAIAIAWASLEVRRALDKVRDVARTLAGAAK
ncbi:MAG: hypothetical protein IT435_02290 [Phycisphaerales bacterium]|nr:hypothetical protein [Phycisphaerales bacterium]